MCLSEFQRGGAAVTKAPSPRGLCSVAVLVLVRMLATADLMRCVEGLKVFQVWRGEVIESFIGDE